MNAKNNKILVVAAHPDDEVLGCGATIAKHCEQGDRVWTLILGEGMTSRASLGKKQKEQGVKLLRKHAEQANNLLGVDKLIIKNFADNQFDAVPMLKIVHAIEKVANEYNPRIIYTHHYGDVNIDHRIVREAVEAVIRPTKENPVKKALAFEIPSSTEWNFRKSNIFSPNAFTQITERTLLKKINALKEYASEVRSFPHPRSPEYLKALALLRGGQSGFGLAEAFELIYEKN